MARALFLSLLIALSCGALPPAAADLDAEARLRCEARGYEAPARPFKTDQCSMWVDGSWGRCCVDHDMDYWCGGSYCERLASDARLAACVTRKAGPMGPVMFLGVQAGGWDFLPTPFRWGYGRVWPRSTPED